MYLKSIEIQGFKSFANKISFEFKSGITGIVGPNGSGKSNVADAVRWVLGEQSAKQLRGGNMQDIIFSGTELRKPLGLAYVAITFDNSDHKLLVEYDQVTVARRVYRSGESEYLINGHICRLRDVQELFLDTGIGKEGYSIIGQGQIDKILSGKPEERRELFDEAVGIVKFKKRKSAAQKNLEEERLNLARISDILSELEKQLEPLKNQSDVAKEYLKQKDHLKQLEVNQFLLLQQKNHDETIQIQKQLSIINGDLFDTKQSYDATKQEYEQLERQLEEDTNNLEKQKQTKSNLLLEEQKVQGDIQILREQITAIEQNEQLSKNRKEKVGEELFNKKEELTNYIKEKEELERQLDELDEVQSQASQDLQQVKEETERLTKEIDFCNQEIIRLLKESNTTHTKIQHYKTLEEQNKIKHAQLNQKVLRNKSEEAVIEQQLKEAKEKLQEVSETILQQTSFVEDKKKKCLENEREISLENEQSSKNEKEYLSLYAKLDSLKNLTERYNGYGNSIRRIMEQKDTIPGIFGVTADLIQTEKRYETAIETALGANIQNIVTKDEETAKELIGFLKRNQFGRATFLPLTSLTISRFTKEDILKESGVINLASRLVKIKPEFQKLADFLLGRILVVDTIQHALSIAGKYQYSLRIVTLEGELLSPGGSISGGSYRNSSNLLGRRREIDELSKACDRLQRESEQQKLKLEELHIKQKKLKQEEETQSKQLQELYVIQNTAKWNVEREEEKLFEIQKIFGSIQNELKELEQQTDEFKNTMQQLSQNLQEFSKDELLKKERIIQFTKNLEQKRAEETKKREHISELRIKLSSLEQNSEFLSENIKRIRLEIDKLTQEKSDICFSQEKSKEEREEKLIFITQKQSILELKKNKILEFQEQIKQTERKMETLTLNHKNFFQKREELYERISQLDKDGFRLQSQLDKLKEQLDTEIEYLWGEYELSPSAAALLQDNVYSNPQKLKKEILECKSQIKALGDVNVNAIEEFKSVSERFTFLNGQYEDLKRSEQDLLGMITELEEEMRQQFEEKFKQIQIQFNLVFQELFGGGKATLELMEEMDILEAGILIIAQPPGKKLQNMMQLSGGEKSLTAISLLFAIQNLKPSPFCLLDEIEAALDDSNVNRYAKYLHKLTKHTQFIVITHRRGTMAAADSLYGITMQEKGVSTLVSVRLIEDELDK